MSIDLIDRVIYLSSKGDETPFLRLNDWLKESENIPGIEFIVEDEKFYWKVVSSIEFKDIINEDLTDWFLVYSESRDFMAIAKKRNFNENLIGEKVEPYISSIWLLKSNIISIKVDKTPIMIWSPHNFDSPFHRINYDFKQLIIKLKDPKVKLTQFVSYKVFPFRSRRIR
jgi:hypothetical protein